MSDKSLELIGLDGANPLGFLAAIGTLRTLSIVLDDPALEMRWSSKTGAWKPSLRCANTELEPSAICSMLAEYLAEPPQLPLLKEIGDNLTISPARFRELAEDSIDSEDTIAAVFLASFGSDGSWQSHSKDRSLMEDTDLRTMSGAGHQHFIRFMRAIIATTEVNHIEETLFSYWRYQDEGRGLNLRWDPIDDRRYAMRWKNPSSDPNRTMRGANRLAIEAVPWFPTAVRGSDLETTGFKTMRRKGTFFHWPIWTRWASIGSVRCLLQHPAVTDADRDLPRGVATVFRSQRITVGKFRNFTPAVSVSQAT